MTTEDPGPSWSLMIPTAKQCPALEVTRPELENLPNGMLTLSCRTYSQFAHSSILYWLSNGSFIEHLPGQLLECVTPGGAAPGSSSHSTSSASMRPAGNSLTRAL